MQNNSFYCWLAENRIYSAIGTSCVDLSILASIMLNSGLGIYTVMLVITSWNQQHWLHYVC